MKNIRNWNWFSIIGISAVVVSCVAVLTFWACDSSWTENHCKPTGESKEEMYYVNVDYGSGVSILTPQRVTYHQYLCDDGTERWR
jgi:hypothetical protein